MEEEKEPVKEVEKTSLKKPKAPVAKKPVDPPEATAPEYFMEQPDTNKYKVFKKNTTNLPEQRAGRVHCNAPKLVEAPKEDF